MKAASFPRPAVAAKELETAIALWETDIHVDESVSGDWIPMTQRKLNLEEMCPEPVRKRLRDSSPEKVATYELMRAEISEWVAEELRLPARPRAAALEQSEGTCGDAEWDHAYEAMDPDQMQAALLERNENTNPNQLSALVTNIKAKNRKGNKGRGAKGEGKGGKRFYPKAAWKTYSPDPAAIHPSQWGQWYPGQPGNIQLQPQLQSLAANSGWMAGPGVMLPVPLRMLATKSVTETKNILKGTESEDEHDDIVTPKDSHTR